MNNPNIDWEAVEADPIVPSATDVPVVPSADEVPVVPSADEVPVVESADEGPVAEGPDNLEALQDYHKYHQGEYQHDSGDQPEPPKPATMEGREAVTAPRRWGRAEVLAAAMAVLVLAVCVTVAILTAAWAVVAALGVLTLGVVAWLVVRRADKDSP